MKKETGKKKDGAKIESVQDFYLWKRLTPDPDWSPEERKKGIERDIQWHEERLADDFIYQENLKDIKGFLSQSINEYASRSGLYDRMVETFEAEAGNTVRELKIKEELARYEAEYKYAEDETKATAASEGYRLARSGKNPLLKEVSINGKFTYIIGLDSNVNITDPLTQTEGYISTHRAQAFIDEVSKGYNHGQYTLYLIEECKVKQPDLIKIEKANQIFILLWELGMIDALKKRCEGVPARQLGQLIEIITSTKADNFRKAVSHEDPSTEKIFTQKAMQDVSALLFQIGITPIRIEKKLKGITKR